MALSVAEIKRFIDEDIVSEKKRRAAVGQRYYEGEHDILKSRLFYFNADGKLVEDTTRANIKIVHPFFTILADQLSSYALSAKENPIQAKKKDDGLQDMLDEVFDDDFWAEIGELITGTYTKGFEYVYRYKDSGNKSIYQCADSMGVVEVQAKDADDGQDHVLYWYIDRIEKGKKTVKRIEDWTKTESWYYVQIDDGAINKDKDAPYNPRPHVVFTDTKTGQKMGKPFGYIPFWRLDYNKKQFSGLKPIKGLIDDYDLHACSLSNNLKDFDTPLYVVSGFQGDNLDELQQNLKTKKIVGVDSEGGVSVQTVDIPYEARKEKLEIDKEGIYHFGMGVNTQGLKDTNATTNLAIQQAYAGLGIKAGNTITRFKAFLKKIVKVVIDEINATENTGYTVKDVKFKFKPETLVNEQENIQNEKTKAETNQIKINYILSIAAYIGDEEALKAICDVLEVDYDEIKSKVKKADGVSLDDAKKALNNAPVVGGEIIEPKAEVNTDPIPE